MFQPIEQYFERECQSHNLALLTNKIKRRELKDVLASENHRVDIELLYPTQTTVDSRKLMENSDLSPGRVIVVFWNFRYLIIDGHHQTVRRKLRGEQTILIDLYKLVEYEQAKP